MFEHDAHPETTTIIQKNLDSSSHELLHRELRLC